MCHEVPASVADMQSQYRTRPTEKHCPHCGRQPHQELMLLALGAETDSVRWVSGRHFCPSGCPITADDVL